MDAASYANLYAFQSMQQQQQQQTGTGTSSALPGYSVSPGVVPPPLQPSLLFPSYSNLVTAAAGAPLAMPMHAASQNMANNAGVNVSGTGMSASGMNPGVPTPPGFSSMYAAQPSSLPLPYSSPAVYSNMPGGSNTHNTSNIVATQAMLPPAAAPVLPPQLLPPNYISGQLEDDRIRRRAYKHGDMDAMPTPPPAHESRVSMFTLPQSAMLHPDLRPYAFLYTTGNGAYPYYHPSQLQTGAEGMNTQFRPGYGQQQRYMHGFPSAPYPSFQSHPPILSDHSKKTMEHQLYYTSRRGGRRGGGGGKREHGHGHIHGHGTNTGKAVPATPPSTTASISTPPSTTHKLLDSNGGGAAAHRSSPYIDTGEADHTPVVTPPDSLASSEASTTISSLPSSTSSSASSRPSSPFPFSPLSNNSNNNNNNIPSIAPASSR